MTELHETAQDSPKKARLPKRDWILLPVIGLLTIFCLEGIARELFSEKITLLSCLSLDPVNGVRGIPNCVCLDKMIEDRGTEYRFDKCGFRSGMECGPKQPGSYRIVMVGSSTAMGEKVSIEDSLGTLLPQEISEETGRKVELYNEAMGFGFPRNVDVRFDDVLVAQPDLIVWVLTPIDIQEVQSGVPTPGETAFLRKSETSRWNAIKAAFTSKSILHSLSAHSRLATVLDHYLLEEQSESEYIKSYLSSGSDTHAGYLKAELSPLWKSRLHTFDGFVADIESRAAAANVPLLAVLLPTRPQAAMLSAGEWPAGYDPYKLDNEVRAIVTGHGALYVDLMPRFRAIPKFEQDYYPLDGHPASGAHAVFAKLLAQGLTNGAVPALKAPAMQPTAPREGR